MDFLNLTLLPNLWRWQVSRQQKKEKKRENMIRLLFGCFIGHFAFWQASPAYCFIAGGCCEDGCVTNEVATGSKSGVQLEMNGGGGGLLLRFVLQVANFVLFRRTNFLKNGGRQVAE